ncbi:MAG: hypothetical protein OEZ06_17815 [Myxococcales bacterium]|nr:hypothetical protein [Myxococcales bacterium]
MALDDVLIDKRVLERNIERGRVDAAEHARLIESLPDRSDNVHSSEGERAGREASSAPVVVG